MGASAVEVVGLKETRGLLAKFEPDLLKRLDRRLNAVARDLKKGAQTNLEKTGVSGNAYRIQTRNRIYGFSKSVVANSGSVSRGEKWSSDPSVLAAIFEFANGVRDARPQNVRRTKSMVATLTARYGEPGRFLWAAWDERKVASLASVAAEIKAVEAEYTKRLQ